MTTNPIATLTNRLYVAERHVTKEMIDEYTFHIPFKDRAVIDEHGKPLEQMMEVQTYQYYPSETLEGENHYGFQRGNLPKLYRVFKDFDIVDKRADPELGFELEMSPEVALDKRWTSPTGQKHMIDLLMAIGSGGIQAPPAYGKTVLCIGLACALRLKTLILVHDRTLADQWLQRFRDHTNLEEMEDIYGEELLGTYKRGKFFPITVATYQSLHSTKKNRQICKDNRNYFGVTINDEGHHESAETFSFITTTFNPKHRFWVSATPKRKDGMHRAIFDMVGVLVGRGTDDRAVGTVQFIFTNKTVNKSKQWQYMLGSLVDSARRNKIIIELALKCAVEEKRKVLIITERVKHAKWLADMLAVRLEAHDMKAISLVGGQRDFEATFKRMEDDDLHILVATKVMDEGKDCKPLDTLIMATPNNNKAKTEQRVGRIQRLFTYPDGRTKQPLMVYDLLDDHPACWGSSKTRRAVYKEIGFKVLEAPRDKPKTTTTQGMPKMSSKQPPAQPEQQTLF
ncbi:MAG: hypothetical protein DRJ03_24845 [Chloroflexi bacterium]|nr:MAG: hypothetical protein DRJ03_24845 [Chloroflexota bacterium]